MEWTLPTKFTGNMANFETWYELVKPFTPKSTCYALDFEEQLVLHAQIFDNLVERIPYFEVMNDRRDTHTLDEAGIMRALRAKIDGWLDGQTYFFRTNLFSPKDVGVCKVQNAEDVLRLLLASRRMYKGLNLLGDKGLHLVFREWVNMQEEFRCFIQNGTVKGISQYDDSNSIIKGFGASKLYGWTEADYIRVWDYVENIIAQTHLEDAVLDVAIGDNGFWVVEINPFSPHTDKCLFALEDMYSDENMEPEIRYWIEPHTVEVMTHNESDGWGATSLITFDEEPVKDPDLDKLFENLKLNSTPLTSMGR